MKICFVLPRTESRAIGGYKTVFEYANQFARRGHEVDKTYKFGMKNVVISKWLKEIVDQVTGDESVLILNPIDVERYRVVNPIETRRRHSIGCLYNPNPCKGFDNAFKVMTSLKLAYPEMGR